MSHLHVKYLLAGGGVAASAAAVAIRQLDAAGSLLMVGQENNRPYHRPPLSKQFLLGKMRHADLFTLPADWFSNHGVDLRTGRRVSHLDTARNAVTLDNGNEISYDRLLLATGAAAQRLEIPGTNLPSLYYLRTLEDVDRLMHSMDKALSEGRPHPRGRGHVAVIGGGLLGVELAGTLSQRGLAVHLVVGDEHPWPRFAGAPAGGYLSRYLQQHGVDVLNDCRAVALEGDGRVQRVTLDDGKSIEVDFAVAAVGSAAYRDLLRNTSLPAERAILVNDQCQTSDSRIFAAGDCSAVFDPLFGKHRIVDHWEHAQLTGTIAGVNMAGGSARYDAVSRFDTTVFDLSASLWGEPRLVERRIVRGSSAGDAARFVEIGIAADGRVASVLAIGAGHVEPALRQLVASRLMVDGNEESLKDESIPLPN